MLLAATLDSNVNYHEDKYLQSTIKKDDLDLIIKLLNKNSISNIFAQAIASIF